MPTSATLSEDAHVILLLCSGLAIPKDVPAEGRPQTAAEWHALARKILASSWGRPGELLGRSAADMRQALDLDAATAERLARLLGRGVQLVVELERLADRGIRPVTRADEAYPVKLKQRLQGQAPPVLFVAGPVELLGSRGAAVVGSRKSDAASLQFARAVGQRCAQDRLTVYSGLAPGVDAEAMRGALDFEGFAVGLARGSLEQTVRERSIRELIHDERLAVVTPFHPAAGFTTALAMARNKYVYCLADYAIVVASDSGTGGTWAGATENLRQGWVPLFVRDADGLAPGNRDLLARPGSTPLQADHLSETRPLGEILAHLLASGEAQARTQAELWSHGKPEPGNGARHGAFGRGGTSQDMQPHLSSSLDRGAPEDLFPDSWPRIAPYLQDPRTERDVAEQFGLELPQAKAWLQRAVEQQIACRLKKPVRYQSVRRLPSL